MQQGVAMKPVVTLTIACLLLLTGCQSLSDTPPESAAGNESRSSKAEAADRNTVLLSAQHCLSEYLKEQGRVHYGPCLKIITINGDTPQVRQDGFISLHVSTPLNFGISCVYRHDLG